MGLLSGGQRQAVSLLMATLAPLKILLLDEHTAALDPRTAEFVAELTRRLVAEEPAHHPDGHPQHAPGAGLGDRTMMLHEGRIVLDHAGAEKAGLSRSRTCSTSSRADGGGRLDEDALLLGWARDAGWRGVSRRAVVDQPQSVRRPCQSH